MNNSNRTYAIFENPTNNKQITKLETSGNEIYRLPMLSIRQIESEDIPQIRYLNDLQYFDWLIFPDVFAVDVFVNWLEVSKYDLFELDNLRVCAYGEAVSDRLRFVQLHADIIFANHNHTENFAEIENYLQDADQFKDLKVLFIKDSNELLDLPGLLENAGAETVVIDMYELSITENTTKLRSLIIGGAIDEFLFSTPDEVFLLSKMFYPSGVREILNEYAIMATNQITLQTLLEFGLNAKLNKKG